MKEMKIIIEKLYELKKIITKISETEVNQKTLIGNLKLKVTALKNYVNNETVSKYLEEVLIEINKHNLEFYTNDEAQAIFLNEGSAFITFEMGITTWYSLKRKEIIEFYELIKQPLISDSNYIKSQYPKNKEEFVNAIELQVSGFLCNLEKSQNKLPRKQKKQLKESTLRRAELGFFGAGLAIGNVVMALPSIGLGAPVAIASMYFGTKLLGAAVFNDSEIIKKIKLPKLKD